MSHTLLLDCCVFVSTRVDWSYLSYLPTPRQKQQRQPQTTTMNKITRAIITDTQARNVHSLVSLQYFPKSHWSLLVHVNIIPLFAPSVKVLFFWISSANRRCLWPPSNIEKFIKNFYELYLCTWFSKDHVSLAENLQDNYVFYHIAENLFDNLTSTINNVLTRYGWREGLW